MLNDDMLDDLVTAAYEYVTQYGLPTEPEARDWIQSLTREDTTPEQAFAPMFDTYSNGLGFTVDEWMNMTYNIEGISIRPDRGGVWVNFDFEFESEDGSYSGERGGSGHI